MPIKKNHAEDELIENMLNTETNGEVDDDHEDIAGSTMHTMNKDMINPDVLVEETDEIKDFNKRYGVNKHVKSKPELRDKNVLLSVRHLKQFFFFGKGPRRAKLKAVSNISFDVHEGECVGIVGESGCGKTTTGRSIIKLYDITRKNTGLGGNIRRILKKRL